MCITHPFHPHGGKVFKFIDVRHNWGEARVFYEDDQGCQKSIPASFTDALPPDPFQMISAGRSRLRIQDLLELAELVNPS